MSQDNEPKEPTSPPPKAAYSSEQQTQLSAMARAALRAARKNGDLETMRTATQRLKMITGSQE